MASQIPTGHDDKLPVLDVAGESSTVHADGEELGKNQGKSRNLGPARAAAADDAHGAHDGQHANGMKRDQ